MTSVSNRGRGTKPKPAPRQYGDGSITQRKDGRYIVRVRDNGTYRQIGSAKHADPAEAQRLARQILDEYNARLKAGLQPSGRDWSTLDWLEHCLTRKQPTYDRAGHRLTGVEPTTYEKYETQLRLHIAPYVGTVLPAKVVDVRREHVERWFATLLKTGLGADALNESLQRLSAAMEEAVDYEFIARNPCRGVKPVRKPERVHVKPSELDLVRLIRAIRGEPLEALAWIAMGGGFRRAEVAGLTWADVSIFSPEHGLIRAHQRRNRLTRRTQQRLNLPSSLTRSRLKSQAERSVDIGATVVGILQQRWQHQLAARAAAGSAWKGTDSDTPDGYLFTTPVGTPIDVDAISKYLTRVRERAGLDIDRFHALRRVFATLLNKVGVQDRVTMEMIGHADLDMTHYYQDPMASQKRDAAQLLDGELQRLVTQANG